MEDIPKEWSIDDITVHSAVFGSGTPLTYSYLIPNCIANGVAARAAQIQITIISLITLDNLDIV